MRRLTLALILITALLLGLLPAQASTSYSQIILASQPERYYRLDETSGITAFDSAHGWAGSYNNSPTLNQSGAIYDGNAAIYLPSNAYVSFPVYSPRNKSFAVEYWVKVPSGASNNTSKSVLYIFGSETWRNYIIYTTAAGNVLHFTHSTDITIATLTADTWYYIVSQFNYVTSRVEIYVNGTLTYSAPDLAYAATGAANFRAGDAGNALAIYLDEYALYENRILSQDEINLHYNTAFAAYNTPTPTITNTPTITFTPSNTPTPTATLTLTPGWDYEIPLPSGRTAAVRMEATAGDISIIMFLIFAVALLLLIIYLRRRDGGSK